MSINLKNGDCGNTNTSGNLLEVDGFLVEGTGGGCSGLIKREKINGFTLEFLLVDNNLSFPADFPIEAYSRYGFGDECHKEFEGGIMENMEELERFLDSAREFFNQDLTPEGVLK